MIEALGNWGLNFSLTSASLNLIIGGQDPALEELPVIGGFSRLLGRCHRSKLLPQN